MIRSIMLILSLMILIRTSSAQEVIRLDQGQVAPFSGNLIKTEKLEEFYKSHKKIPLLEENYELEKQRTSLYRDRIRDTEKELSKAKFKGYLGAVGGFVLGVVITGVAAKAAIEATR